MRKKIRLTPRQYECLHWLSLGKTTVEIGIILGISHTTVCFHLKKVYIKLNATNQTSAITKGFHLAILKIPES